MKEELSKYIKFPCISTHVRELMERSYLRKQTGDFRIYLDEILDIDVDGIIKLEKDKIYELRLPRTYDLLSNFRFTYDKGDEKDFGILNELPDEINELIKEYLIPKNGVDIYLSTGYNNIAEAKKQFTYVSGLIHKTFHFNLKDCNNNHDNFKYVINNKLPIIGCQFTELLLKIKSKENCDLKIKLTCALADTNLRCELARAAYLYDNIAIINGLVRSSPKSEEWSLKNN